MRYVKLLRDNFMSNISNHRSYTIETDKPISCEGTLIELNLPLDEDETLIALNGVSISSRSYLVPDIYTYLYIANICFNRDTNTAQVLLVKKLDSARVSKFAITCHYTSFKKQGGKSLL